MAATGDDEDNIVICQLARDRYGVETTIARVNDPRNQAYFDMLGIAPTVSATAAIMGLIEHEVPEHGLIHLLELKKENLEIVEILIGEKDVCAGKKIGEVALPNGSRVISVVRDGKYIHVALGSLRDEPSIRPAEHIFVGSKAPWFEITDDLPQNQEY